MCTLNNLKCDNNNPAKIIPLQAYKSSTRIRYSKMVNTTQNIPVGIRNQTKDMQQATYYLPL